MPSAAIFLPEAVLLAGAVAVLAIELLAGARARMAAWVASGCAIAAAGLAVTFGSGALDLAGAEFAIDGAARFARVGTCVLVAAFCLWASGSTLGRGATRACSLALLAGFGALVLAGARDWATVLVGAGAATLPVLSAFAGTDTADGRHAGPARLHVTLGIAAMTLALGVTYLALASGSLSIAESKAETPVGWLGAALVTAGLLGIVGAAPFDSPTRAALAGAPAWPVALLVSVPKAATVVALARVVEALAPQVPYSTLVLYGAGVVSMTWGTIAAFRERDAVGLIARAGAVNAGFVLVGLGAGGALGLRGAVFYALAYAVPSMGLMLVAAEEGTTLEQLSGVSGRRRVAAWAIVVFVASLIGIAPTGGFLGKVYVLGAAVRGGAWWAAAAGVLISVLSAGPYGRLVRAAFAANERPVDDSEGSDPAGTAAFVTLAVITLALVTVVGPVTALIGLRMP